MSLAASGRAGSANRLRRIALLLVGSALALLLGDAGSEAEAAKRKGKVQVKVTGLPKGQSANWVIRGKGFSRQSKQLRASFRLRPGRYALITRPVTFRHAHQTAEKGAEALPSRKRKKFKIRKGKTSKVKTKYGTVANPDARRMPPKLTSVVGNPRNPDALVYPAGQSLPGQGKILMSAPSANLPAGLVSRVTGARRSGQRQILSVEPVSVSEAVPSWEAKNVELKVVGPNSANPFAARAECEGPSLFDFGWKMHEFAIDNASSSLWPPQLSMSLQARPHGWMGLNLASAGISCEWRLADIPAFRGAIPTPVGPIPVYGQIPIEAAAKVEGRLSAFRINAASTSAMRLHLGVRDNDFSVSQHNPRVWRDGEMEFSGESSLSLTAGMELGLGVARAGNLHVKAAFGPEASWHSGGSCTVDILLGKLSAAIEIGKFKLGTEQNRPHSHRIWRGCALEYDGDSTRPADEPLSFTVAEETKNGERRLEVRKWKMRDVNFRCTVTPWDPPGGKPTHHKIRQPVPLKDIYEGKDSAVVKDDGSFAIRMRSNRHLDEGQLAVIKGQLKRDDKAEGTFKVVYNTYGGEGTIECRTGELFWRAEAS